MKDSFSRFLGTILKVGSTLFLSAVVCFGQTSPRPAATAAAKPATTSPKLSPTKSPASPNKVVLTVGSTKVTKAQMDYLFNTLSPQARQAVASRGLRALGREYSVMLLLSQKALNDHLDASPEFRRELAFKKDQMLASEEYRNLENKAQITPDEISSYYAAHKSDFEEAEVRRFWVSKKSEHAKPGDPGLSPAAAKARLASIRKAVTSGTDIKQVAKQFNVPNVVVVDPEVYTVRRGQLPPALDKAAFNLQDNQLSEPVDTPHALVAIQVLGHQQADLKDVSQGISNELRQEKVKALLDEMKAKTKIWMDPDYFKSSAGETSVNNP